MQAARKQDAKLRAKEVLRQRVFVSSPNNPHKLSSLLYLVVKVKGAVCGSDKTLKNPKSLCSSAQLDVFSRLFLGLWLWEILI